MEKFHKLVLPSCQHLTLLHWTIPSSWGGWYQEEFWKKYGALWREDRVQNHDRSSELVRDKLHELKPDEFGFFSCLQLELENADEYTYPHRHFGFRYLNLPEEVEEREVIKAEMKALRADFIEACRRMQKEDADARVVSRISGKSLTFTSTWWSAGLWTMLIVVTTAD